MYLFSAANQAKAQKNLALQCVFSSIHSFFIVFPRTYDTVSLHLSPEEILRVLSGAAKAECVALLHQYCLQCA